MPNLQRWAQIVKPLAGIWTRGTASGCSMFGPSDPWSRGPIVAMLPEAAYGDNSRIKLGQTQHIKARSQLRSPLDSNKVVAITQKRNDAGKMHTSMLRPSASEVVASKPCPSPPMVETDPTPREAKHDKSSIW
jgi:hypothetical protein